MNVEISVRNAFPLLNALSVILAIHQIMVCVLVV